MLHPGSRIACCTADGTSTLRDHFGRRRFSIPTPSASASTRSTGRRRGSCARPRRCSPTAACRRRSSGGCEACSERWRPGIFFPFPRGDRVTAIANSSHCSTGSAAASRPPLWRLRVRLQPYAFERPTRAIWGRSRTGCSCSSSAACSGCEATLARPRRCRGRCARARPLRLGLPGPARRIRGLRLPGGRFVRLRGRREWLRSALLGAAVYLVAVLALLPILILYARERSSVRAEVSHRVGEIANLSAKTTAYLLPRHATRCSTSARRRHLLDLTEQTLFFGYTTAAPALAAVVLPRARRPRAACLRAPLLDGGVRRRAGAGRGVDLAPADLPDRAALDRDALRAAGRAFSTYYRAYSRDSASRSGSGS